MTKQEEAREVAARIKGEVAEEQEQLESTVAQAKSALVALKDNAKLAAMYNESASVGSEDVSGGSLPILKLHSAGKSTTNELQDGSEPADGSFYYKPTKEDLGRKIEGHVLTISRGYYSSAMQGSSKDKTWNVIVGGIIGDDKPFIMYFSGSKLQNLWKFGREASQFTKGKPIAIPMFALTIRMKSVKGERGQYAAPWIVEFEIVKNEEGFPEVILDEGKFQFMKDNVAIVKETIASVITAKEIKSTVTEVAEDIVGVPATAGQEDEPSNVPW